MDAIQECGMPETEECGKSAFASSSVDVLLPARLWQSEVEIAELIEERNELSQSVRFRVLLGTSVPLTQCMMERAEDLRNRLGATGIAVRLAVVSSSEVANQSLRVVDAHTDHGYVQTERGKVRSARIGAERFASVETALA